MKLVHEQSHQLLHRMCKEILISDVEGRRKGCVYQAIFRSIKEGVFEFVHDVVKANPDLLWSKDGNLKNIFSYAVLCRQAKIFSLIYGLDVKNNLAYGGDNSGNNILHMAGMPPVSIMLDRIPGAALQMQRELQWFKVIFLTFYIHLSDIHFFIRKRKQPNFRCNKASIQPNEESH